MLLLSARLLGSGLRGLGLLDRLQLLLGRQLPALGDDEHARLDGHVREQLDRDLVAPDPLQRLVHPDLAPVDADLELVPDRVREVRLGDRPEEDAGVAGLDVEAELRLAEPLRDLLRLLEALCLAQRPARVDLLELLHARGGRRLREPAREQEVARIAARDVDDLAAQAELVDVFSEDDLHLSSVRDVRKQSHLPRALHGDGDLPLVAAARAGDAARADLALLGDVAAELVEVLPVHLVDLLLAEVAGPAPAGPLHRLAPAAPALSVFLLSIAPCHQKGMSSSFALPKSAFSAVAPAGTNWRSPPSASPRLPRNWTLSAMISTAWRLEPSCASHSRQSSRPSTPTGRPLDRYCAQLSPWLPQTVTSK